MNIPELIAAHLTAVYFGGNWTEVNVTTVLEDVTATEAMGVTHASPNTIAALVHHLMCWNRIMTSRINGVEPPAPTRNGYNVGQLNSDGDWQLLREELYASTHGLARVMAVFDPDRLDAPLVDGGSGAYRNLQGIVEHAHYHLGQIVLLKKLLRKN